MTYDPEIHHRRSIRLAGYDYAKPGSYYVTLVTQNRVCRWGSIAAGVMKLNALGVIINKQWQQLSLRWPQVQLDNYVIMPNHLHGIIRITASDPAASVIRPSLQEIVGVFKSLCTRECRVYRQRQQPERALGPLWQRNYYEHIIRDEEDYHHICYYMAQNPVHWETDEEYRRE